jgi:RNA polymerase sporulation-specific sigma factor
MDECGDEALVGMIQGGEDSAGAFARLLERSQPVLRARAEAALRRQGRGGALAREDFLQEGMLGFLSAVSSYRPGRGASFRTYLSVCVNNRLISALRRSAQAADYAELPQNIAAMDPQDVFSSMEETRRMMEVIHSRLTPLERGVVERYLAGERYEAIARELGLAPKAVDNAMQRVRRKLKQFL